MSVSFILLYCMTVFIASIIPGPSMLLALTHGMQFGARRTTASALGNVTVTLMQAPISIAGLGTVLIASETVFHLIKWAGAAYLIYVGLGIFCSSKTSLSKGGVKQAATMKSMRKMYLQAALVTAGNPKAIVFFTAIFPQFIDPDAGYLIQSLTLLGLCAIIAFGCFMIYALCGQKIVSLFSSISVGKIINRIIGGSFIGAGIGLAASNR
jgi:threonine/homoserine/homoserine lactone efflux protein